MNGTVQNLQACNKLFQNFAHTFDIIDGCLPRFMPDPGVLFVIHGVSKCQFSLSVMKFQITFRENDTQKLINHTSVYTSSKVAYTI